MKFSELQNGMAVKFSNGKIGMVYKNFMTYDYIIADKKLSIAVGQNEDDQNSLLESFNIVEVRSIRGSCNRNYLEANTMFAKGERVWKMDVEKYYKVFLERKETLYVEVKARSQDEAEEYVDSNMLPYKELDGSLQTNILIGETEELA